MDLSRLNCMKPLISRRSKGEADANTVTTLTIKYVGEGRLTKPGLADMCEFVNKLLSGKSNDRKKVIFEKRRLDISGQEMCLTPLSDGVKLPVVFRLRRVQFCGICQGNPKVFFFTYQFGKTPDLVECHVLLCKSRKEAKKIAKRAQVLFKDITFSLHKRSSENTLEHVVITGDCELATESDH